VDDGSTDNTREVLRPYLKRIRYVYQENQDMCAARNTGLKHCTGEFIVFLDADDLLGPGYLRSQIAFLNNHSDYAVAVCRNRFFRGYVDQEGTPKFLRFFEKPRPWYLYRSSLDVHLCYFNIAPPAAFFFRRSVVCDVGLFDTSLQAAEDYDYFLRCAVKGYIPRYNPNCEVYYHKHTQNKSQNLIKLFSNDIILHRRLSDLLDEYPKFPDGHRLEGLLAFVAGCLLTMTRVIPLKLGGVEELQSLVLRRMGEVKQLALQTTGSMKQWTILDNLFLLRSLVCLKSSVLPPDFKNTVRSMLYEVMVHLNAPYFKGKVVVDGLKSFLFGSSVYWWERWTLLPLLYKYLLLR